MTLTITESSFTTDGPAIATRWPATGSFMTPFEWHYRRRTIWQWLCRQPRRPSHITFVNFANKDDPTGRACGFLNRPH